MRPLVGEVPTGPGATEPVLRRPRAAAAEARALEPALHKRSHRSERPSGHGEEQPSLAAAGESPRAKIYHSQTVNQS